MGRINDKLWRVKAVLRPFGPAQSPVGETSPPPRAGWTASVRLSHAEIHPPNRWRRRTPLLPSRSIQQTPEVEPGPRIHERRGWIDPAP